VSQLDVGAQARHLADLRTALDTLETVLSPVRGDLSQSRPQDAAMESGRGLGWGCVRVRVAHAREKVGRCLAALGLTGWGVVSPVVWWAGSSVWCW
jgi:hypothetical protein